MRTHSVLWKRLIWLVVVGAAFSTRATLGACIFIAGQWDGESFKPKETPYKPCYSIRYATASAEIEDRKARTTLEVTLTGPVTGSVTVVGLIPIPAGLTEKDVDLVLGDKDAKALKARFLSVEEAEKVYAGIAKGADVPSLMALTGRPAFLIPEYDLTDKATLKLHIRHQVPENDGLLVYEAPVPGARWSKGPVRRLSLNATVKNGRPLRAVFSPTHEVEIERKGLFDARIRAGVDHYAGSDTFRIVYVADEDPLGLRVLAHRIPGENEGYFLLFGNPTGSVKPEKPVAKDVVFVLDTSGSMRGEKNEQTRAAVEYCLGQLNAEDRFNLITFGTEVHSFSKGLVAKTPENLKAARTFAEDTVPLGRTNISEALTRGLAGEADEGRPRIMIFLTDGTPTAGELRPDEILKKLPDLNRSKTRIFVVGVGHDVNVHLLDQLALGTEGLAEYISPDEEIDVKVAGLYNRLAHPVLSDVKITFGELTVNSMYPRKVPTLFRGSQIMLAGRYRDGGKHTVTIAGTLHGKPVDYTCKVDFPKEKAPGHEYVATLWASRVIGYLLQEIRLKGQQKELIEEVVRLSRKYGIVTEYTAFLSTASTANMTDAQVASKVAGLMKEANGKQSGQWAFNQAQNEQALQQRAVAMPSAAGYVDRAGRRQKTQNIKQIGRRVFYQRDGLWVDAEVDAKAEQKKRVVKMYSEEYFELVKKNRDFAKAQDIGAEMVVNIGDENIEVRKKRRSRDAGLRAGRPRSVGARPSRPHIKGEVSCHGG